jgi:hypothetical protein
MRKLSSNDRLIGAIRACRETGVNPAPLYAAVAAALRFSPDETSARPAQEILTEISQVASADQTPGNAIPNNMFLTKMSKTANTKHKQAAEETFARFPLISVQKHEEERGRSGGNTFLKVSKFVPMYLQASAFEMSPRNKTNRTCVLRVKALPMSDLEDLLFRSQLDISNSSASFSIVTLSSNRLFNI